MLKEAKRKAKFARKQKPKEEMKMHDINKTITLDDITRIKNIVSGRRLG